MEWNRSSSVSAPNTDKQILKCTRASVRTGTDLIPTSLHFKVEFWVAVPPAGLGVGEAGASEHGRHRSGPARSQAHGVDLKPGYEVFAERDWSADRQCRFPRKRHPAIYQRR